MGNRFLPQGVRRPADRRQLGQERALAASQPPAGTGLVSHFLQASTAIYSSPAESSKPSPGAFEMSIDEMITWINLVARTEKGAGASDQEIVDVERAIGVQLPNSYKAFLATFGWARIDHDPLYGVGPDVPRPYALVRHVISERTDCEPAIPKHLVPFMNDGAGNHYCLETSYMRDGECPVVFWDHEHEDGSDQSPLQLSSSFDHWIVDRIIEHRTLGE